MNSEQLDLTGHQEQVYKRFCRALVNLPVYFGDEIVLLSEEEQEIDRAFGDAFSLCEEMEDGEGEITLDFGQVRMLAFLAGANVTEQVSPAALLAHYADGRNFND